MVGAENSHELAFESKVYAVLFSLNSSTTPTFLLTSVIVRRGTEIITVLLRGNGPFRYQTLAIDAQRLVVDFPGGQSLLRQHVLPVDHPLLDKIRIGQDARRLRVVFDIRSRVRYAVRKRPRALAIQFQSVRRHGRE